VVDVHAEKAVVPLEGVVRGLELKPVESLLSGAR